MKAAVYSRIKIRVDLSYERLEVSPAGGGRGERRQEAASSAEILRQSEMDSLEGESAGSDGSAAVGAVGVGVFL